MGLGGAALLAVGFQSALRSGERSDKKSSDTDWLELVFQSALRSGERSDGKVSGSVSVPIGFNPRFAPESEAMRLKWWKDRADDVSIRASLRRAKR